jgi:hypothetical protein
MIERLSTYACALDDEELAERRSRFRELAQHAVARDESSWRFPPELELARELAELAVLESRCCGASFALSVEPNGLRLALVSPTSQDARHGAAASDA